MAPTSRLTPRMPLQVIIAAANTVSRASVSLPALSPAISVPIRPPSMAVTATASTREPNGSPTRCAITSAWWTAASTDAPRKQATTTSTTAGGLDPHVNARITSATGGMMFTAFTGEVGQRYTPPASPTPPRPRGSAAQPSRSPSRLRMRKRSLLLLRRVFGLVALEQLLLLVALGEQEEDEHRTEHDRNDAGGVRPVGAVEEGLLGCGGDLTGVLGVLLRDGFRAGERLGQLTLDTVVDLRVVRRGGDRGAGCGGVAGGEQGAEDGLHDRAAEVALEIGGARRHPGAPHRDRPGQRVRCGRAGEPDADPDEHVGETDPPVGHVRLPEQQHRREGEEQEHVAAHEREAGAARLDELGRARRDEHHEHDRRQERRPGLQRRVAEHVLQELLADERGPHQRAEHDDPRTGGDPEDAP